MNEIKQSKYILGQSRRDLIEGIGDEARIDLKLTPSKFNLVGGTISGTVFDEENTGIRYAVVKLMSENYDPLMHTITNGKGNYTLQHIPAGTYNIFCIAQGKKLSQANPIVINELESKKINFFLETNSSLDLGVIAGDLLDMSTNLPVKGAVVSLYLDETSLEAITYTNQYGQFAFRQIPKGNYTIKVSALGYNDVDADALINQDGQIINEKLFIVRNIDAAKGTVSGIITNDQNLAINRADVILYKVNEDNSLIPIAFTKTNVNGVYLFMNIDDGKYIVKSNEIEITTIDI